MNARIHLARPGDERLLDDLAPDVFDDPPDAAATSAFLADPHHHLALALDAGVVVGMATAVHYLHPDKPHPELWINEVGVAPTHQRRGLGKALMRALMQAGRAAGCREAWVLTEPDNHAAQRLYTALDGRRTPSVLFAFPLGAPDPK